MGMFGDPMHRCKICRQTRNDSYLAVVKMADIQDARQYDKPLSDFTYHGNYIEIKYCRDDMACGRGARETAGDLIVE